MSMLHRAGTRLSQKFLRRIAPTGRPPPLQTEAQIADAGTGQASMWSPFQNRAYGAAAEEKPLKLGFIGAGGINFGSAEGPWNHALRLDKMPGVEFTAIVDPNVHLAQARVSQYANGTNASKWKDVHIFQDYKAMLNSESRPDAVFIGLPPQCHGSIDDPRANIEVELAEAGIHMFVEKPLSVKHPDEVARLSRRLTELQQDKHLIIAVGYMLRYSPAVEMAKKILAENDTPLACLVGRYAATYNHIHKRSWWDTAMSGGTIVEQATHFVDLMRYFGGEIDRKSIMATALGPDYPLTAMPSFPEGEHLVPWDRRINRVTSANWRFHDTGAIGSLIHSSLQHEQNYFTSLELMADGLHIIIGDPYNVPSIKLRRAGSNTYEDVPVCTDKDMYVHQFEGFLKAVRTGDSSELRCPYQTAALTYQASQWITIAANNNRSEGPWTQQKEDDHSDLEALAA